MEKIFDKNTLKTKIKLENFSKYISRRSMTRFLVHHELFKLQLNVQGNYIANNQGTCTFFNNSTEMWHGVEPIYEGTRFVLLIWFGREEHDSQMQPVSEGTESGDSEVSLASEEQ